jgi:hypothetical protein
MKQTVSQKSGRAGMEFSKRKDTKGQIMFHPHFFHNAFLAGPPDAIADAIGLFSACRVE